MTTSPEMRDLAQRLLDYEAFTEKTSEPAGSATLRVYEKLRHELGEFAGVAGFQSLASRALVLAKTEAPSLSVVRVGADGSLQGLGEIEHQFDIDKIRAGEFPAGSAAWSRRLDLRDFRGRARGLVADESGADRARPCHLRHRLPSVASEEVRASRCAEGRCAVGSLAN